MSLSIQQAQKPNIQIGGVRTQQEVERTASPALPNEVRQNRPVDETRVSAEAAELDHLRQSPDLQSVNGHSNVQALLANYGTSSVNGVVDSKTVGGVDTKNSTDKLGQADAATQNVSVVAARMNQQQKIQLLDVSNGSDSKGLSHRPPGVVHSAEFVTDESGLATPDSRPRDPLQSTFTASDELKDLVWPQKGASAGQMIQV